LAEKTVDIHGGQSFGVKFGKLQMEARGMRGMMMLMVMLLLAAMTYFSYVQHEEMIDSMDALTYVHANPEKAKDLWTKEPRGIEKLRQRK
jgi:hypothetical protein